ncbi:MAG: non-canonical purine NTP pyrophosphatase [Candidatus Saccharimonas sp.]
MKINYVTTNKMKFEIAQAYFETLSRDYEIVQYEIDTPEIQDVSAVEIARHSALWAAKETGEICIKMDAGFFIASLRGFPGPFVKYVNDWLTQEDYLKLLSDKPDRSAYFEDATAIGFPDGRSEVFSLKTHGSLALESDKNNTRWPANLLFIPDGYSHTLGSMSSEDQNIFWGEGNWPKVIEYLKSNT